jgi:hypothetical protein
MVKKALCLVIPLAFLIACSGDASATRSAFSFEGKPIHPRCVRELWHSDSGRLDLGNCRPPSGFEEWKVRPGYWIAEFPEEEFGGRRPYFAYAPAGRSKAVFVLSVEEWGGGSGRFTDILIVARSGDELRLVKTLGEGDRCNGGLVSLSVKGSDVYYSRNTTPMGIIDLAPEERLGLFAYKDLDNSASSCAAQIHYKYSLTDGRGEWLSVTFGERLSAEEGWTSRFTCQSCFNKVFNGYVDRGKTELNRAELDEFVREFKKECLAAR